MHKVAWNVKGEPAGLERIICELKLLHDKVDTWQRQRPEYSAAVPENAESKKSRKVHLSC